MQDEIRYQVILSGRRTISLIVSPDKGVIIRAPYMTSASSIRRFVKEKEGWIRNHLERHSEMIRLNTCKKYEDGEIHHLFGRECRLQITESPENRVVAANDILEVRTERTNDKNLTRFLLERFYRLKAQEFISSRYQEIKLRYPGFLPTGLAVKPLRSRWGSCSSLGKITISSELVKLDPVFADYVIIHELCHLKHHNHGKDFYRQLENLVPDYKSIRKELRKYLIR